MKRYLLLNGFTLESMDDCPVKSKKYKHYIAKITGRTDEGEEIREYMPYSKDYDEWFNVSSLKPLDMVRANVWYEEKRFEKKKYLVVIEKTNQHIDVEEFATYLKAKQFIDEHSDGNLEDVIEQDRLDHESTGVVERQDLNYVELVHIFNYLGKLPMKQDKTLNAIKDKLEKIIKEYKG